MASQTLVNVTLPEMGESVSEGSIVEWRKKVGDWVEDGETLVDVTTDKVDVEVPSTASGVVTALHGDEGSTIAVGAVLVEIDTTAAKPEGAATAGAAADGAPKAGAGEGASAPATPPSAAPSPKATAGPNVTLSPSKGAPPSAAQRRQRQGGRRPVAPRPPAGGSPPHRRLEAHRHRPRRPDPARRRRGRSRIGQDRVLGRPGRGV